MGGEHPDWLPLDWKVSVKIRSFGRKDKYYIHPSTGLTLSSKPEVLRYLKNSEKQSEPKKINKIAIDKPEKLPRGWIEEVRIRKSRGKTKRDVFYTDSVSGRQFRSMQEALRYLKSKDSREVESKSADKDRTSMELVDHSQSSSAEAKVERSIVKKGEKNMTDGESIKSGPVAAALKNVEKPLVKEKLQNKLSRAKGEEQRNGGRRMSKRLADNKLKHDTKDNALQSGSEIAADNNMNILPERKDPEQPENESGCTEVSEQPEDLARQNKRRSMKRKWVSNLPRRTSRRLAHLEAEQSVEANTSKKNGASARLSSNEEVDSTKNGRLSSNEEVDSTKNGSQSEEPEIDTSVKSGATGSDEQCKTENPTNDDQKKPTGCENLSAEDQEQDKHVESSLKDFLMDPCIEFAIKTLTGAIPIEDVNKVGHLPVSSNQMSGSSSMSPSGDIWSDPCFEFAVKTLTGEMPPEDGLQLQGSFENPVKSLAGSGSLPKIERRKV